MTSSKTIEDHMLLSRTQASEFLGVCKTTLDRLGIPSIKLRRRVLYRPAELDTWLMAHTQRQEGFHGNK